jgi:arylformamidase
MQMSGSPPRFVDLSHTIEHGMITYKGLPAPIVCDYLSREESRSRYAPGTEFQIGKIEMVANTGTYIDSPFHRFDGGDDIAQLQLSSLANLPCIVVRVTTRSSRAIDRLPENIEIAGAAVLFHTGWDNHWRTDQYFEQHPHLTGPLAELLVQRGAALVGIDSFNIDSTDTSERPVHTTLLRAGIPIVEHLCNVHALPDTGARFYAVPPKVRGMGTFPVRAFARLQDR